MENKALIEAVEKFVALNQKAFDDWAQVVYPNVWADGGGTKLEYSVAKKYIKVWAGRYDRRRESIHAFIDMATGDILMAAGLNKPAKHARGNVFSPQNGAEAFSKQGHINYMR